MVTIEERKCKDGKHGASLRDLPLWRRGTDRPGDGDGDYTSEAPTRLMLMAADRDVMTRSVTEEYHVDRRRP
jgi:hypothetical protein